MGSMGRFEEWISGPPYERDVTRNPGDATVAWPGKYVDDEVQLAWQAWQAASRLERENLLNILKSLPRKDIGEFDEGDGQMVRYEDQKDGGEWVAWDDIEMRFSL